MAPRHATSPAYHIDPFTPRSPNQQSRLSRRVDLLLEGDARLPLPRLFRDICREIANDLGGADQLSTIQRGLIKRYAGMSVLAERIESDICQGKSVDIKEAALISSTVARLASRLGIKRQAKDITPSIQDWIASHANGHDDAPRSRRVIRSRVIDHDADENDDD
jgi:hypothetical protein